MSQSLHKLLLQRSASPPVTMLLHLRHELGEIRWPIRMSIVGEPAFVGLITSPPPSRPQAGASLMGRRSSTSIRSPVAGLSGQGSPRGLKLIADYVLVYKNLKLAVDEVKAWDEPLTEGVAQAKSYADKSQVRFAYASN